MTFRGYTESLNSYGYIWPNFHSKLPMTFPALCRHFYLTCWQKRSVWRIRLDQIAHLSMNQLLINITSLFRSSASPQPFHAPQHSCYYAVDKIGRFV